MGSPAARTTDKVAHPLPGMLGPGPGSINVITGNLPSWRGLPAAAAAALQAAKAISDAVITTAETASTMAAGTPAAPAAIAAEKLAKAAAMTAMSSLMNGLGAACAALGGTPDLHICATPLLPPPPHGPGMVIDGSPTVLVNGLPFCAQGDNVLEALGPLDPIVLGCPNVLVGKPSSPSPVSMLMAAIMAAINAARAGIDALKDGIAGILAKIANAAIAAAKAMIAKLGRLAQSVVDKITQFAKNMKDKITGEQSRRELVDRIKSGKSNIKIVGTDEYKAKVADSIDTLSQSPTGRELLESLEASGKSVTIQNTQPGKGNTENAANWNDGLYDEANGKPGAGTDSTVDFNPDRTKINSEPWMERDPAVGLGHELIHADHDANGTTDGRGSVDYIDADGNKRSAPGYELQGAGLGEHADNDFTENKIRKDFEDLGLGKNGGEKQRPYY